MTMIMSILLVNFTNESYSMPRLASEGGGRGGGDVPRDRVDRIIPFLVMG